MCTRTVGEEGPFSIASPARVADPRPYQGGQSDAGFPAGIRHKPTQRAGRHEALVQCSGEARAACSVNGTAAASARSLGPSGRPDQGTGQRADRPTGCRNGRWPEIRLQPRFCCLSGLGYPDSTAPAASQTCWASASVATRTCAACWCNAPGPTCSTLNVKKGRWPTGYARC
ncbi:hypothetical protein SAMN05216205_6202 [Pseudomonas mohnii]|uniref:Uncharacterized protein n=1 Tax=Pseudomonas mohnii TaxID=395600 RepID=A0ABY0YVW7_9PSED|nr:hypothetical protein SAMN05216205_6202 [Pseudomonas mohnii]